MDSRIRSYLSAIGAKGGRKSRRKLSADDARAMVRVREARRAYRRFQTACFWSYNPDLKIRASDIDWVAEQLRKNGGRAAWEAAERLCR